MQAANGAIEPAVACVLGGWSVNIRQLHHQQRHQMTQPPSLPIRSPCIKLCVIEPDSGFCIGCGRSREEIAGWVGFTAGQRDTLMLELPERLKNLTRNKTRRGGRRGRFERDD
jgi:predicted Fe-S protein YdhL (DUF1289 family)